MGRWKRALVQGRQSFAWDRRDGHLVLRPIQIQIAHLEDRIILNDKIRDLEVAIQELRAMAANA